MKKKITKNKKFTVTEFKYWFMGLCEFYDDEWVPNRQQWVLIKERIENLVETSDNLEPRQTQQQTQYQPPEWRPPAGNGHYELPAPAVPLAVSVPPPLPAPTKVRDSKGNELFRTPQIDTSAGEYVSGFE